MKNPNFNRWRWAAALAFIPSLPVSAAFAQESFVPTQQTSAVPAAQPVAPVVSLTIVQASSFQGAFTALAQQGHVAFVAEDQSLHVTLLPRQVPRFKDGGEPLSQMVTQVAAAYDYDAERHGSVFVLKKLYSDAADLPDVTLAECARSLEDLQNVIGALNPHLNTGEIGKNESVANFLTSLTPAQLEMMKDKSLSLPNSVFTGATEEQILANSRQRYDLAVQSQGLPISTLTPAQREVVGQMLLVTYVELPSEMLDVQPVIKTASGDPSFCRRTDKDVYSFGYELPEEGKQKKYTRLTFWGGKSQIAIDGVFLPPPADQSAPLLRVPPVLPYVSVTLAQAISSLDARTGFQPKMLVAKELAPKRVSLFGADNAPPAALLQALADVYGLSVQKRKDKSLVLARQDVQIPLDYAAMVENAHKAMPDPIRRALAGQAARSLTAQRDQPVITGPAYPTNVPQTLRNSALRALRTAVEPRLRTAKDGHVLLSVLGDRENATLALALALPEFEAVSGLASRGIPEAVTRFDELCLRGGPSPEDKGKFGLEFYLPVMGGTVPPQEVDFIGNIDYTPNSAVAGSGTP